MIGVPVVLLFIVPRCCPNSKVAKKVETFKQKISNKYRDYKSKNKTSPLTLLESRRVDTKQSGRFLQTESLQDASSTVSLFAGNAPIQTKIAPP